MVVKFITKYFITFGPIINGVVFLISFLCDLLLVCRNAFVFFWGDFVSCDFAEFILSKHFFFVCRGKILKVGKHLEVT